MIGEEEIEKYRVNIQGISELIALVPQLKYAPIPIELTRKLQLISSVFEQAMGQDLNFLGELWEILESLKIASIRNQKQPLHLVKLIITVCQKAKISIPQLFLSNFKELENTLSENFGLELTL